MDQPHGIALAAGIAAAVIMPVIAFVAPGLLKTDGALSAAKLQFFLWTEVALFTYAFLFTAHALGAQQKAFAPTFPDHLLLLMGLSITAATASKALPKWTGAVSGSSLARFVQDAKGDLALPKVQMLAWTLTALGVYLYTALTTFPTFYNATAASYPDVDTALLALVGLGQGAFVVNRFVDQQSTD